MALERPPYSGASMSRSASSSSSSRTVVVAMHRVYYVRATSGKRDRETSVAVPQASHVIPSRIPSTPRTEPYWTVVCVLPRLTTGADSLTTETGPIQLAHDGRVPCRATGRRCHRSTVSGLTIIGTGKALRRRGRSIVVEWSSSVRIWAPRELPVANIHRSRVRMRRTRAGKRVVASAERCRSARCPKTPKTLGITGRMSIRCPQG